jgi:hypothetical protein
MSKREVVGIPIEVDFGRSKVTFFIHPDGPLNEDSIETSLKIEAMQRAARKFAKIQKQLNAGTLDDEEYQVELEKLNKQKGEAVAKIGEPDNETTLADIEEQYKAAVDSLLNARDGEAVSIEEYNRLETLSAQWYKKTLYKPFAVPFLRSCVLDWDLTFDEDSLKILTPDTLLRIGAVDAMGLPTDVVEGKLPVTHDTLDLLSEDQLKLAFVKISTYYGKQKKEEKKSIGNLTDTSQSQRQESAESLNGFRSIESPELTELSQARLLNGESLNSTVLSQN